MDKVINQQRAMKIAKELQSVIDEEAAICNDIENGTSCWTSVDCEKVVEMQKLIDELIKEL